MDNRDEIRDFLATRRAKITPQQAGPAPGVRRRVPGLRREEVAVLAGVSTDWYTRLEKGHISGVSEEVLNAVAQALQLDDAERAHLFDLARAAGARPRSRRPTQNIRPGTAADAGCHERRSGHHPRQLGRHPRERRWFPARGSISPPPPGPVGRIS